MVKKTFIVMTSLLLIFLFVGLVYAALSTTTTIVSPTDGSIHSKAVPIKVRFGGTSEIDVSTVVLKMNGEVIPSQVRYDGIYKDYYDTCSGWYKVRVGDDLTKGYVTGSVDPANGGHNLTLTLGDMAGNTKTTNWSFRMAAEASVTSTSPTNGQRIADLSPQAVLKVSQYNALPEDDISAELSLDGIMQPVTIERTGTTTWDIITSLSELTSDHQYTVSGFVYNQYVKSNYSFNFTPTLTSPTVSPTPADGTVFSQLSSQRVKAYLKDIDKIDQSSIAMTINGEPIAFSLAWDGIYQSDSCGTWRVGDDYTGATITGPSYQSLANGDYSVTVTAKDRLGNEVIKEWSFTVAIPPTVTSTTPVDGARVSALNAQAVIKVSQPNAVAEDTINAKLMLNDVKHSFTVNRTGTTTWDIKANFSDLSSDQLYSVTGTVYNQYAQSDYSFSFTPSTTPPSITPNPGNGTILSDLSFWDRNKSFQVYLKDPDKIDQSSIILTVNGETVPYTLAWDGIYQSDSCGTVRVGDDYTGVTLSGPSYRTLTNGNYLVNVSVKDQFGFQATKEWSFKVDVEPQVLIKESSPKNNQSLNNLSPSLTYRVDAEMSKGVNEGATSLMLDGVPLDYTAQSSVNIYGATVWDLNANSDKLENESSHTVALVVYTNEGKATSYDGSFYINTYGEMSAGATDCGSCHQLKNDGTNTIKHVNPGPPGVWDYYETDGCNMCHGDWQPSCAYCHTGDGNIYDHDGRVSGSFDKYPEIYGASCLKCHSKNSQWGVGYKKPVLVGYPYAGSSSPYPYVHEIYSEHNSALSNDCTTCHSQILTRTHNNKTTESGANFTCATCHNSTNQTVRDAIAAKDTSCTACHASADHNSLHTSNIDGKCTSCHQQTLTQDHISRQDDQGNNYTCNTCHQSDSKLIKRTIAADSLNCAGCHEKGHGLRLADTVPADIPLNILTDAEITWSTPIEAKIFQGEPTTPAGYETGQVVISSRRTDVTAQQVWDYYTTEMTANGWIKQSGLYDSIFTAVFEKEGRFATIRCFNTLTSDGQGDPVSGGYRVEIWYK